MRRAKGYGRQDWAAMKREGEAIDADMAALLAAAIRANAMRAWDEGKE